ncbi:MAG: c-type cytochrome [Hyphomicrobiales bacterium]|nr:c-type cytochrome [Hyphomicrobiales bacterium]
MTRIVRKTTFGIIAFAALTALAVTPFAIAQNKAHEPLAALPPMPIPKDNPMTEANIALGKHLFFDARLSGDASISCADCHDPKLGWGDGSDLSRGYPGTMHWRNSQTVVNSGYLTKGWFWTSSAATLEAQAHSAIAGALAGNLKKALAEERMKQVPEYVRLFKEVWNAAPNYDQALASIAAYERTIISDDSPFDRYMRGEKSALSEAAVRGMALFEGKAGCAACHSGPLLTDQKFYNIGLPTNPAFTETIQRQIAFRERMRSSGFEEKDYLHLDRDPGRYRKTKKIEDIGKFRTPPLRYIKYTAPYMHNGVFFDLREVVEFYNKGGESEPFGNKSEKIKPLGLTEAEITDLIAFLDSLSGKELVVERPKSPPYGLLKFPMKGQW